MNSLPLLQIGDSAVVLSNTVLSASRTIEDYVGSYTIPYIQSSRDLFIKCDCGGSPIRKFEIELMLDDTTVASTQLSGSIPQTVFSSLADGEYSLHIGGLGTSGQLLSDTKIERIGIGLVIAALGDSITEGYYGGYYQSEDLNLKPEFFPVDAVSKDGRNYPQFGPMAFYNKQGMNCLKSWMTDLNDLLSDSLRTPVFIANEGWAGMNAHHYLEHMRFDMGWRRRMQALEPRKWLIHLGVNDALQGVEPDDYERSLNAMGLVLQQDFEAKPQDILIALPSYCYHLEETSSARLRQYCEAVDAIIRREGYLKGPDFFDTFSRNREKWYGADLAHPNEVGTRLMAELWHRAIIASLE